MNDTNAKFFCSALLGLSLMGVTSRGGPPPPQPPAPEERLSKLKTELGLSEAQVQKLKPILEENMSKMKALHEASSLSEEQRKEKAHAIRKAGGDAIMAELTADQKVKFEEELKKHRKEGPPGPGGPARKDGGTSTEGKGPRKGAQSGAAGKAE